MDHALWVAKTGLDANHKYIEIVSNNLANGNTIGFKRNRPEFEDLVYRPIVEPGTPTSVDSNSPGGQMLGTGVRIVSSPKIYSDGSLIQTDNSLDLAITGRGFLSVMVPPNNTLAYTRDGSLQVNELGQLVTSAGYVVQPEITIPQGATNLSVSKDGLVTVMVNNAMEQLGQIQLSDFVNQAGLEALGGNLLVETVSSGPAVLSNPNQNGVGMLTQGSLEASNVDIVEEMVNLIEAQRSFEVSTKAVTAIEKMLQQLSESVT